MSIVLPSRHYRTKGTLPGRSSRQLAGHANWFSKHRILDQVPLFPAWITDLTSSPSPIRNLCSGSIESIGDVCRAAEIISAIACADRSRIIQNFTITLNFEGLTAAVRHCRDNLGSLSYQEERSIVSGWKSWHSFSKNWAIWNWYGDRAPLFQTHICIVNMLLSS
jgi:hypothetical protein